VSLLSSPRRRRRLAWLGGSICVVLLVVGLVSLVPNRSSQGNTVVPRTPAFGAATTTGGFFGSSAAEERAAARAETTVRPLAQVFVDDLALRHDLPHAYALLAPSLRRRYSLADWRRGRGLPLAATGARGGVSIAFSGATTVGLVADLDGNRLFAVRFDRTNGRWLVDYVRQGRSSRYVSADNFSPAGFAPGSRHETAWTWIALIGGLVGLIAIGVFFERALSR
jgi:hypothetical protein